MTLLYSVLVSFIFKKYSSVLQTQMKFVMVFFAVMLFVRFVSMFLFAFIVPRRNKEESFSNGMWEIEIEQCIISFVIMDFYYLMFALKRVEMQVNPRTDSVQKILSMIRKQRLLEVTFLSLTALTVICIFVFRIFMYNDFDGFMYWAVVWIILGFSSFVVNIYIIIYFVRMASFLMGVLGVKININNRRTKIFISVLTTMLIISLFFHYVYS